MKSSVVQCENLKKCSKCGVQKDEKNIWNATLPAKLQFHLHVWKPHPRGDPIHPSTQRNVKLDITQTTTLSRPKFMGKH